MTWYRQIRRRCLSGARARSLAPTASGAARMVPPVHRDPAVRLSPGGVATWGYDHVRANILHVVTGQQIWAGTTQFRSSWTAVRRTPGGRFAHAGGWR